MAIILPRTSEGAAPNIECTIISAGGIVARCPDCRKLTLLRWLTLQRQVGAEAGRLGRQGRVSTL